MRHKPKFEYPGYDWEEVGSELGKKAAKFREVFESAVDMLPNLHTFISRPMSSERIVTPHEAYPISAGLLQGRNSTYDFVDEPIYGYTCQSNDGLILFPPPGHGSPGLKDQASAMGQRVPRKQLPPSYPSISI